MNKMKIGIFFLSAAIFAAVATKLIKPDSELEQITEQAIKMETGMDVDLSPE